MGGAMVGGALGRRGLWWTVSSPAPCALPHWKTPFQGPGPQSRFCHPLETNGRPLRVSARFSRCGVHSCGCGVRDLRCPGVRHRARKGAVQSGPEAGARHIAPPPGICISLPGLRCSFSLLSTPAHAGAEDRVQSARVRGSGNPGGRTGSARRPGSTRDTEAPAGLPPGAGEGPRPTLPSRSQAGARRGRGRGGAQLWISPWGEDSQCPRPTCWHWFPDPSSGLSWTAKMPSTLRSSSPRILTPRFFSTNQVTFWAVGRITEEIGSSERRCPSRRNRLQLERGPVGK